MIHPVPLPPWAILHARWPTIFDITNPRPLKVGIHKDIILAGVAPNLVRLALVAYANTDAYKKTLLAGAERINLEGQPDGEVTVQETDGSPKPQRPKIPILPTDLPLTDENIVAGKLEVIIKLNTLPKPLILPSGVRFGIEADGRQISTAVKAKVWKKLTDAAAQWPLWVATLVGKMGPATKDGFALLDPAVQVFERKAKAETTPVKPVVEKKPEPIAAPDTLKTPLSR